MATPLQLSPLHLAPVGSKAVARDFDGGRLSSDGGLVLRNAPDNQIGLPRNLAAVLRAPRDPRRVHFTLHDLLQQRVLHIAAGYEEANDATTLRHAPLCKLLRDRLPDSGRPLASQPTLSRCANRVSRTALSRMARVCVEQCIASYARPPTRIVLDVDDPEDPAHGAQEQVRYDGHYGGYGFLPLHVYEGLSGRLLTPIFTAKRFSGAQRRAVWKRLVQHLRHAWPATRLIVRGDSHCASPEVRQWSEAQPPLHSGTGWTSNAVLQPRAHAVVEHAKRASARDGGKGTRCHSTRSQAGTWAHSRRVGLTVEVSAHGVNTRCVVTDLEQARTQGLSRHLYWARGQAETERKDHKRSWKSDRTACHRCEANQCRVLLQAAASVFLDPLRREGLRATPWAAATMEPSQWRLRKLGARVQEWRERVTISLPASCPVAPVFRRSVTILACIRLPERAWQVRSRALPAQGPSGGGRPQG